MNKTSVFAMCTILMCSCTLFAQDGVVISGFGRGVGSDVPKGFFKPFAPELKRLSDILKNDPNAYLVSTGCADAVEYRQNHPAKNGGLSVNRSNTGKFLMVEEYGVDPRRIETSTCEHLVDTGAAYRSVTLEVRYRDAQQAPAQKPAKDTVFLKPQIYNYETISFFDHLQLHVSLGGSSTPYGFAPLANVAISWDSSLYLECTGAYTPWYDEYATERYTYQSKNWFTGVYLTWIPQGLKIGPSIGYERHENVANLSDDYLQMHRGFAYGAVVLPIRGFSIAGYWIPGKEHTVNLPNATWKSEFRVQATVTIKSFGGAQ